MKGVRLTLDRADIMRIAAILRYDVIRLERDIAAMRPGDDLLETWRNVVEGHKAILKRLKAAAARDPILKKIKLGER